MRCFRPYRLLCLSDIHIICKTVVLKLLLLVHNGDYYGAPRALLILEAQALLARFLRDFAISMVANIDTLTVGQTVQKLSLPGGNIAKPSEPEEPSWMHFGITYYNVSTSPASHFLVALLGIDAAIFSAMENPILMS